MKEHNKGKLVAITVTVIISGILTYWGILGIGVYGLALFVLTPMFIGFCPVVIYGHKRTVSRAESRNLGFLTLGCFSACLLVFAMEGLICLVMAAPIGLLLTWIGTVIGHGIIRRPPGAGPATGIMLMLAIPTLAFLERNHQMPEMIAVTTSIEIDAGPEDVWKHVVEFPTLSEPTEFIFRTGIAYPINAEIKGQGIGAIRYCNFSTGSFVEPITSWDEPNLLKFDVAQNPAPMKELSFYDIDAPHLHDYFVSKQGQFKLTKLANGKTLLEGTTWYYHNIRPVFYWKVWSDYIIHKIHLRVLNHIKEAAEDELPKEMARLSTRDRS
jgi:hypothetical protein